MINELPKKLMIFALRIKNKKAPEFDGLKPEAIKIKISDVIAKPPSFIINECIKNGIWYSHFQKSGNDTYI